MLRWSLLFAALGCPLAVEPALAQPPVPGPSDPVDKALERLRQLGAKVHTNWQLGFDLAQPKPPLKLSVFLSSCCKISDSDLKLLQQVPKITEVVLESPFISDAGLQWLPPQLERLTLWSDAFTDRGLESLKSLDRLKYLDVESRSVTDQGVKTLAGLKPLRQLTIFLPRMTAAGLKEVETMQQLTYLRIEHYDLPDAAIAELRKKLPHLKPPAPGPRDVDILDSTKPTLAIVKWPMLFKVSRQKVTPQDDVIRRLNKERFNAALDAVELGFKRISVGATIPDGAFLADMDAILDAALALGDFPERTLALDGAVQVARLAREIAERGLAAGGITLADVAPVRYGELTVGLRVLKATGQVKVESRSPTPYEPALPQPPAPGAGDPRQKALNRLRQLGAQVGFGSDPYAIRISPRCTVSDSDLKLLQQVPEVTDVGLESPLVSDAGLQWLPPQLKRLTLWSDTFTDRGLESLKRLDQLEYLHVDSRDVTDQGLKTLAGLKQLRGLRIFLPRMTAAGLKEIETMQQLTYLRIEHCDLPDDAIAQLRKKLAHLKSFNPQLNYINEPTFYVMKIPVLFKVSRQKVTPQDDVVRRLNKERLNAALDAVEQRFKRILIGAGIPDISFLDQVDGILDAALALGDFPERTLILDGAVQLAHLGRQIAEAQFNAGKIGLVDLAPVRYHQATVELRVLETKGQAPTK